MHSPHYERTINNVNIQLPDLWRFWLWNHNSLHREHPSLHSSPAWLSVPRSAGLTKVILTEIWRLSERCIRLDVFSAAELLHYHGCWENCHSSLCVRNGSDQRGLNVFLQASCQKQSKMWFKTKQTITSYLATVMLSGPHTPMLILNFKVIYNQSQYTNT